MKRKRRCSSEGRTVCLGNVTRRHAQICDLEHAAEKKDESVPMSLAGLTIHLPLLIQENPILSRKSIHANAIPNPWTSSPHVHCTPRTPEEPNHSTIALYTTVRKFNSLFAVSPPHQLVLEISLCLMTTPSSPRLPFSPVCSCTNKRPSPPH